MSYNNFSKKTAVAVRTQIKNDDGGGGVEIERIRSLSLLRFVNNYISKGPLLSFWNIPISSLTGEYDKKVFDFMKNLSQLWNNNYITQTATISKLTKPFSLGVREVRPGKVIEEGQLLKASSNLHNLRLATQFGVYEAMAAGVRRRRRASDTTNRIDAPLPLGYRDIEESLSTNSFYDENGNVRMDENQEDNRIIEFCTDNNGILVGVFSTPGSDLSKILMDYGRGDYEF